MADLLDKFANNVWTCSKCGYTPLMKIGDVLVCPNCVKTAVYTDGFNG